MIIHFDKSVKKIQWEQNILLTKVLGQLGIYVEDHKFRLLPQTVSKNSMQAMKLLEESIGITLYDVRLGKVFLDMTSKAHMTNLN